LFGQAGCASKRRPDEARIAELAATLALAADHRDDPPAARDQPAEAARGLVRHGPRLRPHGLGGACDRLGVEPVGPGQPARGAGEVADPARVDDHRRRAGGAQRRSGRRLGAAGGLKHDQCRGELGEPFGQDRQGVGIPPEREGLAGGAHVHVEPALGDADADGRRVR
jgi:hypothetical protein